MNLTPLGWVTRDPLSPDHHLRPRHGAKGEKNRKQHEAFLSEVGADSAEHAEWVAWFRALPLWIEKDEFRVVHACWDPEAVATLQRWVAEQNTLYQSAYAAAYSPGDPIRDAIDVLLKGPEVGLPDGVYFSDKDGHVRHEIRTRWWDPTLTSFKDAYIGPDGVDIPDVPIPAASAPKAPDRPTFIGHYWLDGEPAPLTPMVACVDYSVAKGGPLVAYRFDGEDVLSPSGFVSV